MIIGICIGLASAAALVVMWRLAERLRRQIDSDETIGTNAKDFHSEADRPRDG